VLPDGIERYGVSGNILLFVLFAFYDKKKKGKKLNKGPIWEKGKSSDCQSLVRGRLPLPEGVRRGCGNTSLSVIISRPFSVINHQGVNARYPQGGGLERLKASVSGLRNGSARPDTRAPRRGAGILLEQGHFHSGTYRNFFGKTLEAGTRPPGQSGACRSPLRGPLPPA
jgi:hypothetical protein